MRSIEAGAQSIRAGHSFLIFRKARAAGPVICCRSKRAASSWPSRPRRRLCRSPCSGGRAAMTWRQLGHPAGDRHHSCRTPYRNGRPGADKRDDLIRNVRREIEALLATGPVLH